MQYTLWADRLPIVVVYLLTVLFALLALELGYRLGRWRHLREGRQEPAPIVGSILALLAFIMAFAFGMTGARFDARKVAVVEEANAIGTAYLRTDLLPSPQREESRALLREYTELRLTARDADPSVFLAGLARSLELQQELWSRAVAVARQPPPSINHGLYLQSINQVIDQHGERMAVGLYHRIPAIIWFSLYAVTGLGLLSMGYRGGVLRTRQPLTSCSLTLAFSTILLLVVFLDRPQSSMGIVSQQSMIELLEGMGAEPS